MLRAGGTKALFVAAAVLVAAACDNNQTTPVPSGQGNVLGRALGTDFSYSPGQLTGTFEPLPDGRIDLSIRLCQTDCEPLGVVVAPTSRAVMLSVTAPAASFTAPVVFHMNQPGNQALAVWRDDANRLSVGQSTTQITPAIAGTLTLTEIDLRAGGSVTGRFAVEFDDGGSVIGEFFAPVLIAGPTAPTTE